MAITNLCFFIDQGERKWAADLAMKKAAGTPARAGLHNGPNLQ
jgi:hypothetical protein